MNKIATYLQGHLQGEVLVGPRARATYSKDASILEKLPDAVVFPKDTQDVRKIARFAWQLAEKGHVLSLTARGAGQDTTGGAIGAGIVIDMSRHLNRILEVDTKRRLARVQAGVSAQVLSEALFLHGLCFPPLLDADPRSTIGGALASNYAGKRVGKYGGMAAWIDQVEVVLANGDIMQTGRLSKKELNKKKGLTMFEGEVYRTVDGILTDEADQINEQLTGVASSLGYNIAATKQKDGSLDATALLLGSQGTLGLVTEVILRLVPYSPGIETAVVACDSLEAALDATATIRSLEPAEVTLLSHKELQFAQQQQGIAYEGLLGEDMEQLPQALLFITFDDTNERLRRKKAKRLEKALSRIGNTVFRSDDYDIQRSWRHLYERTLSALTFDESEGRVAVPFVDTITIPEGQIENYLRGVQELSTKLHATLHVWGDPTTGIFQARALLDMRRVTDRQKIFRLIDEYLTLVLQHDGDFGVFTGEGRLLAPFIAKKYPKEVLELFIQVKKAFDPFNILNAGAKTGFDPKKLVPLVTDDYSPYK
ncbi:MAG TPA: FAD-binding oxidoreductase [Verrucomicrobiae bacterium]|nr:FAD-binding oxidoreductase [Verrucomicrobiae bacterium]